MYTIYYTHLYQSVEIDKFYIIIVYNLRVRLVQW